MCAVKFNRLLLFSNTQIALMGCKFSQEAVCRAPSLQIDLRKGRIVGGSKKYTTPVPVIAVGQSNIAKSNKTYAMEIM